MNYQSNTNQSMQSCIDACTKCYQMCLQSAMNLCLEAEGKHVEPEHIRLMLSCAEICQTSAKFMLMSSDYCNQVCQVCTEICEACANSCEQMEGMEDCANACRECSESCNAMAGVEADRSTITQERSPAEEL